MEHRCDILEDKIDQHMRALEAEIKKCGCAAQRKVLEEERTHYLLDVTSLLYTAASEDSDDEEAAYPDFVTWSSTNKSSKVLRQYKIKIEKSLSPDPEPSDDDFMCPCGSTDIVVNYREALLICQECGLCRPYWHESGNLSYNEEKQMVPEGNFMYQRINHLKELLAQIQGKQQTEIPAHILNAVRLELKKQRITDVDKIDMLRVNKILRSLKLIKYYEHSNYITYLITGRQPMRMTEALENKICSMFHEVQAPWVKYKPPERHNFISYHYTLYQMCRLLNADEFLPCFTLLKSPEKLHRTNMEWKKICQELNWEFTPADNF